MGEIKIISENGQFDGLREYKDDCINVKVSDFNRNNKFRIISFPNAKVVRLLIDIKPDNEAEFFDYLNNLYTNNPNIEFHINIEFDKYFEYAKEVMSKVKFKTKSITLWPDMELKDRSYLDLSNLNCPTIIPLQYVMWHNSVENANTNKLFFCRTDIEVHDGSLPFSVESKYKDNGQLFTWGDGSNLYTLKDALFLKRTAIKVLTTELKDIINCNLGPDQKILVIMKYLVDNFIYSKDLITQNRKIKLINTVFPHRGAHTLINKCGVCEGISEAFMILLNNPIMKIDCRCLGGLANRNDLDSGHSWNIARLIDEKNHYISRWFYMDPTWNIYEKSYYRWTFLKTNAMSRRKIFDCANPVYDSYDNAELSERVMAYRLNDAMRRIEKRRMGAHDIRIIQSLEEIQNNARRKY